MAVETERRQLLGETVADYYYDILSFCSRLNLPKSEWLYCFVRGLRPEIRELPHVILRQPPDLESASNIAKLKELVTLSRKSNNGQEVENFEELQCHPSEEEIKQSVGEKINVWRTDFQNNENRRINRKFRSSKFNRFRYGGLAQMVEHLARYTTRYQESDLHPAFILLNLFTTSTYSTSPTLLLLLLTY